MDSGPSSSTPKPASKPKQSREKKSNRSFLNSDTDSDREKEDDIQEQEKEDDIQDTERVEKDAAKTKVIYFFNCLEGSHLRWDLNLYLN